MSTDIASYEKALKSFDGKYVQHKALKLNSFSTTGPGWQATADIPKDTVLFEVPNSIQVRSDNSKLPDLPLEDDWTCIILEFMRQDSLGEKSVWHSYIQALPKKYNIPLMWNEEEQLELEGCLFMENVDFQELEADYEEKIVPFVTKHPKLFGKASTTKAKFWQFAGTIMSRAFSDDDGKGPFVVPVLDMFNTTSGAGKIQAELRWSKDKVSVVAIADIKKDDQVFVPYGHNMSNVELFRRYGFLEENNPHDYASIPTPLVSSVLSTLSGDDLPMESDEEPEEDEAADKKSKKKESKKEKDSEKSKSKSKKKQADEEDDDDDDDEGGEDEIVDFGEFGAGTLADEIPEQFFEVKIDGEIPKRLYILLAVQSGYVHPSALFIGEEDDSEDESEEKEKEDEAPKSVQLPPIEYVINIIKDEPQNEDEESEEPKEPKEPKVEVKDDKKVIEVDVQESQDLEIKQSIFVILGSRFSMLHTTVEEDKELLEAFAKGEDPTSFPDDEDEKPKKSKKKAEKKKTPSPETIARKTLAVKFRMQEKIILQKALDKLRADLKTKLSDEDIQKLEIPDDDEEDGSLFAMLGDDDSDEEEEVKPKKTKKEDGKKRKAAAEPDAQKPAKSRK